MGARKRKEKDCHRSDLPKAPDKTQMTGGIPVLALWVLLPTSVSSSAQGHSSSSGCWVYLGPLGGPRAHVALRLSDQEG